MNFDYFSALKQAKFKDFCEIAASIRKSTLSHRKLTTSSWIILNYLSHLLPDILSGICIPATITIRTRFFTKFFEHYTPRLNIRRCCLSLLGASVGNFFARFLSSFSRLGSTRRKRAKKQPAGFSRSPLALCWLFLVVGSAGTDDTFGSLVPLAAEFRLCSSFGRLRFGKKPCHY